MSRRRSRSPNNRHDEELLHKKIQISRQLDIAEIRRAIIDEQVEDREVVAFLPSCTTVAELLNFATIETLCTAVNQIYSEECATIVPKKPLIIRNTVVIDENRTMGIYIDTLEKNNVHLSKQISYGNSASIFSIIGDASLVVKLGNVDEDQVKAASAAGVAGFGPKVARSFDCVKLYFKTEEMAIEKCMVMQRVGPEFPDIFEARKLTMDEWEKLCQLPFRLFQSGIYHADLHFGNILASNFDALVNPVENWLAIDYEEISTTAQECGKRFRSAFLKKRWRKDIGSVDEDVNSRWERARKLYSNQEIAAILQLFDKLDQKIEIWMNSL